MLTPVCLMCLAGLASVRFTTLFRAQRSATTVAEPTQPVLNVVFCLTDCYRNPRSNQVTVTNATHRKGSWA